MPKFSKKVRGEDKQEATDSSGLTRQEREDLARVTNQSQNQTKSGQTTTTSGKKSK